MDTIDIVKLKQALWSERSTVREVWDIIERYVLPFTGQFYRENTSESSLNWLMSRRIYDTTAVMGAQLLAADLHANMSSDAIKWNKLKYRSQAANDDSDKSRWMEGNDESLNQAIRDSNFSLEISEMYLGLVSYGPAVISLEEIDENEWEGVTFKGIPIKESFWTESYISGRPEKFIRVLRMTPAQMVEKWGDDVPYRIKEANKTTDGSIVKEDVLWCIYPRKDKSDDGSIKLNPKERPFGYKYVLESSKEMLGQEGGYYSMPIYIPRWRRHIDSIYGYSPGTVAMGSILDANRLIELELEMGAIAAWPTILVRHGSMWGSTVFGMGKANIVTDINGIQAFDNKANYTVSNKLLEDQQEQIRNAYFTNYIQLKESPQMTAYETSQRIRQTQKFLGPTYGRLVNDLFDPMIKDLFWIMYRNGQFEVMPKSVLQDKEELDIEYIGPLALAQRGQTSSAIKMYLQGLAELSPIYPNVLDIPDIDAAAKRVAQLDGVPVDIINEDKDIKKARKDRANQQQAARQIAMAQAGGDAAQSVAKAEQMGADIGG
jgi:Bacteriophage head to tail connecting protein